MLLLVLVKELRCRYEHFHCRHFDMPRRTCLSIQWDLLLSIIAFWKLAILLVKPVAITLASAAAYLVLLKELRFRYKRFHRRHFTIHTSFGFYLLN